MILVYKAEELEEKSLKRRYCLPLK